MHSIRIADIQFSRTINEYRLFLGRLYYSELGNYYCHIHYSIIHHATF